MIHPLLTNQNGIVFSASHPPHPFSYEVQVPIGYGAFKKSKISGNLGGSNFENFQK